MSSSNDINQLRQAYRKSNNLDFQSAFLGDENGLIPDNNKPGNVWVTVQTSNGQSIGISVKGPTGSIPSTDSGTPVVLGYDKKGRLKIDYLDVDNIAASGQNPLSYAFTNNSNRYTQAGLETLGIIPDANQPSLTVFVKAWLSILARKVHFFPGGAYDLTDYVPADGFQCMAGLFIQNDFETTEIQVSTPTDVGDLWDIEDHVQQTIDLSSQDSTAVYGIKLIGLQTTITQDDILIDGIDYRSVVGSGPGSTNGNNLLNTIACTATGGVVVLATGKVGWIGGNWI